MTTELLWCKIQNVPNVRKVKRIPLYILYVLVLRFSSFVSPISRHSAFILENLPEGSVESARRIYFLENKPASKEYVLREALPRFSIFLRSFFLPLRFLILREGSSLSRRPLPSPGWNVNDFRTITAGKLAGDRFFSWADV